MICNDAGELKKKYLFNYWKLYYVLDSSLLFASIIKENWDHIGL